MGPREKTALLSLRTKAGAGITVLHLATNPHQYEARPTSDQLPPCWMRCRCPGGHMLPQHSEVLAQLCQGKVSLAEPRGY